MRLKKKTFHEIIRFAVVGVAATVLHYGIYFLLYNIINVKIAFSIGYAISFIFNYIFSARFTFRKKTTVKNGFGFGAAHLFNYLLQMTLLHVFLWLGVSKPIAPLPVYCIAIPTNFLLVRFVFSKLK
ncbi:MAG: GtrA family protein [Prevotella sp.]|nr:GtrA family protein [Prevotella sp.]